MSQSAGSSMESPLNVTQDEFPLWIRPKRFSPLVLILIGVMLALIVPPVWYLFESSFHSTLMNGDQGPFTTEFWVGLYKSPLFLRYTLNTAIYALGSAVLAIALGVGQAWIVARTDTPLRKYVFLFSIISLGIPSVLYTSSWLLILGKAGPVNEILMALTGRDAAVINVYSMWGMILIEGFTWAPLAFLLISSVFSSMDASFEEASLMSGAAMGRTFREVTLRLALPGMLALAFLITIRAFESFEVPSLAGMPGNIFVLTTEIYSDVQFAVPPNVGKASALSVALLIMVVFLLWLYGRLTRRAERFQTISGRGHSARVLKIGRLRYLTAAVIVFFFLILIVLPLAMLIWMSLMPYIQHFSVDAIGTMTLDNYRHVLSSTVLQRAMVNSIILGIGTATIATLFTLVSAWYVVRKYRGAWLLDQLATMPLIFPAIVLGVAFLQIFIAVPFAFYGTLLSIIFASFVRYMPYGMRYAYAGILQIHPELEQASAISGASQFTTFVRIVVPLVTPALITCWIFVFLLVVGSVSLPVLLAGPNSVVVAVLLFEMWGAGETLKVAALGLIWTALMTVFSVAFYVLSRRYGLRVR